MEYNVRIFDGIEFREAKGYEEVWFSRNGLVVRTDNRTKIGGFRYVKKKLNPKGNFIVMHYGNSKMRSMYVHKFVYLLYSGQTDFNQMFYFKNDNRNDIRFDNIGVLERGYTCNPETVESVFDYLNGFEDTLNTNVSMSRTIIRKNNIDVSDIPLKFIMECVIPEHKSIREYWEYCNEILHDIHNTDMKIVDIAKKHNLTIDAVYKIKRGDRLKKPREIIGY